MRKLIVTSMLSLDGVMQGPGGRNEDSSGGFKYAGWTAPYGDAEGFKTIVGWIAQAGGIILGRKTYQIWAAYWPKVRDPKDPIAGPLNRLPKFVASRTLKKLAWDNATLLKGDVVSAIKRLKAQKGKELQVHGSSKLLQTVLKARLVDELRLIIFPVILGKGKRLFGSGARPSAMELVDSKRTSTGVMIQVYRSAGTVKTGTVGEED